MSIKKENKCFIFDNPRDGNIIKKTYRFLKAQIFKRRLRRRYKVEYGQKKYNVSICAIFKNEAKYLKEWIEYHTIVGIEHFYLYNNNSEDNYADVLLPYIEKGIVTLTDWKKNQAQMECYHTCIKDYSNETKWLGFIDIDEFINPIKYSSVYDCLKNFENRGSVVFYWKIFGTSGLKERDENSLVTKDFVVCWPKLVNIGKCFYNTKYKFDKDSSYNQCLHHLFFANNGKHDIPPVDTKNHVVMSNYEKKAKDFGIQINHYFTKSYKEYLEKKSKGDVYFKINPHDEAYFYEHEMKCSSVDYSIYKYLIKLELRMGKKDE